MQAIEPLIDERQHLITLTYRMHRIHAAAGALQIVEQQMPAREQARQHLFHDVCFADQRLVQGNSHAIDGRLMSAALLGRRLTRAC